MSEIKAKPRDSSPPEGSGGSGAPEKEVAATPEMIKDVAEELSSYDSRFDDPRDVAMKIIELILRPSFCDEDCRHTL